MEAVAEAFGSMWPQESTDARRVLADSSRGAQCWACGSGPPRRFRLFALRALTTVGDSAARFRDRPTSYDDLPPHIHHRRPARRHGARDRTLAARPARAAGRHLAARARRRRASDHARRRSGACSPARCRRRPRRTGATPSPKPCAASTSPWRDCADAQEELRQLFALLALPPARLALARVSAPWNDASEADVRAFLDRLRDQFADAAARRLRRAASADFRRVVRQSGGVAAIGYSGPAGPCRMTRCANRRIPDPYEPASASGWKVIDASTLARRPRARGRCRHRRQRRGRRHGRGNSRQCRTDGGPARGRSARDVAPTFACAKRRPIRSCTRNRPRARRATRPSTSCRAAASAAARRSTGPVRSARRRPRSRSGKSEFGLAGFSVEDLAPWFARMEARLSIAPWDVAPNANNAALPAVPRRSASRPAPSAATSRAAGTWATAAWAARPTPSSRCWSRPFPARWPKARRW